MNKYNLSQLLGKPHHSWEKFHQETKIKKMAPVTDPSTWPKSWTTIYFKDYPRLDKIILPKPTGLKNISLEEALLLRKSSRKFSNNPVALDKISNLLFYCCGLKDASFASVRNRTYPSPGGRYALEIYLISQKSELPVGIYHYNLRSHSLEVLLQMEDFNNSYYFNQDWSQNASFIIIISAIFERNTIKYGRRGYRHVLEEAGHIGQNFYLVAQTLDLGICGIGGYPDDDLNRLLDIDGIKETVVYVLAVGNKPTSSV